MMSPDAGPDASAADPALEIVAPDDGSSATLVDGEARVTFRVLLQGIDVLTMSVDEVDVHVDSSVSEGTYPVELTFTTAGTHQVVAEGWREGELVVSDVVRVVIESGMIVNPDPGTGACRERLEAIGLEWEPGAVTRGIADPVRIGAEMNGVRFRYISNSEPSGLLMDCELALALNSLTLMLHERGVVEIGHQGVYNYRCIGGGDPDSGTCRPSQHAYATAIDLNRFLMESGETYRVDTDFVIDGDGEACDGESRADAGDRFLHEVACWMYSERVFAIILTPNYNDDHRDHFHVDLTEGSHFIGVSVIGVDPPVRGLGH